MKIIVCVKQVPDTTELRIDPVTGTLIRKGVPSIMNYDDKSALEEALKIKDIYPDTHIVALSMGPAQAKEVLEEALAMGADEAVLLSDRKFGGADTWATSATLKAAIEKIGDYDLIFAGRQAIDGDTAQVGPQIAERLGIPQVTYVQNFEISEDKKTIKVQRSLEDGYEVVEVKTPALLTAIKQLNEPRYMNIGRIVDLCNEDKITVFGFEDIDIDPTHLGLKGSPTQVKKSFTPEQKGAGEMLEGTVTEMTTTLVSKLKEKHLI